MGLLITSYNFHLWSFLDTKAFSYLSLGHNLFVQETPFGFPS